MPNKKSNRRIAQQLLALFVLPLCIAVLSAGTVFAVPVGEPDLSGGTDMVAEIDQSTQIDGMSITGTSESDVYLSLSVDQGILSFGTDTGLTYDGDTTGTELFVHGSIADLNTALGTLTYVGDSVGTTQFGPSLTRPDER